MTVYFDISTLQEQAEQARTETEKIHDVINQYQVSLNDFINDPNLTGQDYNNAKNFGSSVITPLLSGLENYYDEVAAAFQKLHSDYLEHVDAKSWNSDDLEDRIRELDMMIDFNREAIERKEKQHFKTDATHSFLNNAQIELMLMDELKRKYEEILQRLYDFDAHSTTYFDSLNAVKADIETGFNVVGTNMSAESGTFTIPANMDWAKNLNNFSKKHEMAKYDLRTEEKWQFFRTMQMAYGFDEKTASIMIKVKHGIDDKLPDKEQEYKDYVFARLMGAICYEDGLFTHFIWSSAAGPLTNILPIKETKKFVLPDNQQVSLRDIFLTLNIKSSEIEQLSSAVKLQHSLSYGTTIGWEKLKKEQPEKIKEFKQAYKSIYGKNPIDEQIKQEFLKYRETPDFSHQMITTASIMDIENRSAIAITTLSENHDSKHKRKQTLDEITGWRGDVTHGGDANPSINSAYYMSDLDSVNITTQMKAQKQSLFETTTKYYRDLKNGTINRAKEFLNNNGHSIEEIKEITKNNDLSSYEKQAVTSFINSLEKESNYLIKE